MEQACIDDRILIVLDPATGAFRGAHRDRVMQWTDQGAVIATKQITGEPLTEALFQAVLPDSAALISQLQAMTAERDAAVTAKEAAETAQATAEAARNAALARVAELEGQIAGSPPDDLAGYAAWKRRAVAYGGAVVSPGVVVDSSPEGAAMLTALIESLERGYVTAPVAFRATGGWVSMDLAKAQAVAAAVAQHVQACFALHRAIDTAIADGSIDAKSAIDDPASVGLAAWPSNGA